MSATHPVQNDLFYRSLFANALDGVLITDEKGWINFASDSISRLLGFQPGEITGTNTFEYTHPDDRELAYTAFMNEVTQTPSVKFISVRLRKKSGDWIWTMVRGHNLMNDPYVKGIVIYCSDDTMRRQAEDRLQRSEEEFRRLISGLQLGVVVQNEKGEIIFTNQSAEQIIGMPGQDLRGITTKDPRWKIIHEDGNEFHWYERPSHLARQTKKPVRDVVMGVWRPDRGGWVWTLTNADPNLDENGNVASVVVSFTDITEQKRLSRQLIRQELLKQKQLTQATIDGQEKERLEIGKELHDNINQHLSTTRLYLEVAREKASGEVLDMINYSHNTLAAIINQIRMLSQSLVPPTLGDLGLAESVQELCDTLKRTHKYQAVFFSRHFHEEQLPENLNVMLFRIVQEQINNIIRHAEARKIQIRLESDAEYIMLTITDDGKGFDPVTFKKGQGFNNISSRAGLFNGQVQIDAAPGEGCKLMVTIPLSNNQEPDDLM